MSIVKYAAHYRPPGLVLMTLLTSFFADIKSINWGLVHGGFVDSGILGLLYVCTIGAIFILAILYNKNFVSRVWSYPFALSFILILFYLCTFLFDGRPNVTFDFFIVFTITALIIPQVLYVDAKYLVAAMMIFPSFSILRLDLIFQSYLDWMNVVSMDASYAYLVPIVANIVYLFEYFKKDTNGLKFVFVIISIINFIIFIQLFLFGSRGPLLAIFLLVIFLWTTKAEHVGIKFIRSRIKFVFITLFCVVLAFQSIMLFISSYLTNRGITVYAIEKVIDLGQEGDISNGRKDLNKETISGFINSPIWGNGIARYGEKSNTGHEYPHNFILQILYDGGIILFCLIIMPIFFNIRKFISNCTHDQYAVFCTLFFASVPGALLSQNMWNIPVLWLFVGFILSKKFVYKYE